MGYVRKDELRNAIEDLGKSRKSYKRWCKQALELGLLRDAKTLWFYASLEKAARILQKPPVRPILVPIELIFSNDWKAIVWGAWVEANVANTKPITRKTLFEMSGVPESTQRWYDQKNGMTRKQNYAVWDNVPGKADDWLTYFQDHGDHPGAFIFHGRKGAKKRIAWPLGNTYVTPFSRCKKGQVRKARTALRSNLLLESRRVPDTPKLFYEKFGLAVNKSVCLADSSISEVFSRRTQYTQAWTVHKVS